MEEEPKNIDNEALLRFARILRGDYHLDSCESLTFKLAWRNILLTAPAAAQNNVIRKNYVKAEIHNQDICLCWLFDKPDQTVNPTIRKWKKKK